MFKEIVLISLSTPLLIKRSDVLLPCGSSTDLIYYVILALGVKVVVLVVSKFLYFICNSFDSFSEYFCNSFNSFSEYVFLI